MDIQYNRDGTPFVVWGGNKIQLEVKITNPKYLQLAERELRETPEVVENALTELRRLLKSEKTLYIPAERDDFLIKFLRPCKFYPESAFKKILAYYKFMAAHPDYCYDLIPSATRLAFRHSIVSLLAPRDQHGRRIILVESGEKWNPREVPLIEVFRSMLLGMKGAIMEPQTQICGIVSIVDMKGLSLRHVMQYTPSYAKMVIDWTQECVPLRLKAIHIINHPYIFNMLFSMFKPFLSDKLRSRIHLHGSNMDSLIKHIDPKAVRQRHGGLLPEPEISGDIMWRMLHHYEEDYKLAGTYGYVNQNGTNNNNQI